MGGSAATSDNVRDYYDTHRHIRSSTSSSSVFTSRNLKDELDPAKLKNGIRESCDSLDSPNSRAVAIGFDVTGSMGRIPYEFIKEGFPKFINMIQGGVLGYDPHILFAAIGDVMCDSAPLQVTQFEADTRMLDQLRLFYLEGGGGGNDGESYTMPYYFLARHTKIDCFNKRGKKGIFISVGDDKPHPTISRSEIKEIFGSKENPEEPRFNAEQLRDMAAEKYHLYHILLSESGWGSWGVPEAWKELLGPHVALLEDSDYLPDLLATILKMQNGLDKLKAIGLVESAEARKHVKKALNGFEVYPEDDASQTSTGASREGIDFI